MKFILFTLGIVTILWSSYEIIIKESTFLKTFEKEKNPKEYWMQTITYLLIGLILLYLSFF